MKPEKTLDLVGGDDMNGIVIRHAMAVLNGPDLRHDLKISPAPEDLIKKLSPQSLQNKKTPSESSQVAGAGRELVRHFPGRTVEQK